MEAILSLAQSHRAGENLEAAIALLGERVAKGGPWTRPEAERLCSTWVGWLYELRDIPGLSSACDTWVALAPASSSALQVRLTAQYLAGRSAEADRWVLEKIDADLGDGKDEAANAARSIAVQFALGQGWNFWSQVVPLEWRGPLAGLALRLARSDLPIAEESSSILGDGRFSRTDEGLDAVAALRKDLVAPGAVASLPLARLGRYLRWGVAGLDDAARAAVAEALVVRWRATAEGADAQTLTSLVLSVLPARGRREERIVFLREALARAKEETSAAAASRLFQEILAAPFEAGREDEAFALLPRLLGKAPGVEAEIVRSAHSVRSAQATRALAAWVAEGHRRAALGTPEERAKRTRAEATRAEREAQRTARTETAARFATAVAAAVPPLRSWLEVERLGYAAEALADVAKVEGETRELLDAIPIASDAEVDALLAQRCVAVLMYEATRRTAPAGLADRVLALLQGRLDAKGRAARRPRPDLPPAGRARPGGRPGEGAGGRGSGRTTWTSRSA